MNMTIDHSTLTKGQIRKLNALRKSVGDDIAENAFDKWMKTQTIHLSSIILLTCLIFLTPNMVLSEAMGDLVEVYLVDQLDDQRSYCIDIKGYKSRAKVNRGLQAHTCYSYQGEIAVDQGFDALKLTKNQFFLPAFDVCMEASSIAASENIRLKNCRHGKLQEFKWNDKGRIHLISNFKLCLTAAQGNSKKGGGGSPVHLMRNLSLELCSDTLNSYQIWGVRKLFNE